MFYEIFSELCLSHGEAPNTVAKKLGVASGTVSEWKKGRIPKNSTLKKLSVYFEVTSEYLLGKTNDTEQDRDVEENNVVYRYDGVKYTKCFSKEQMEALHVVISSLPEKSK